MKPKYQYKFRPTYGHSEMLIEFFELDKDALIHDLLDLFVEKGYLIGKTQDMWMVDELWIYLSNKHEEFIISNALYGYVFIMASKNDKVIYKVDKILRGNNLFEKEEVNFDDYKLEKKKPSYDKESIGDSEV